MLEGEVCFNEHVPEFVCLGVHHDERVVIDDPGPKRHSRRLDGLSEFVGTPFWLRYRLAHL